MSSGRRCYLSNQSLPYDEDICHEFKGHRNIIVGEIPPLSFKHGSRSPISKTINALLNTGIGGTIYCGVTDDGTVKGLNFSPYQMDHMRVSMQDALSCYRPSVPSHRWKLEFIPILEFAPSSAELDAVYRMSQQYNTKQRERSHVIGTHQYCWCDKDAVAAFNNGVVYSDYIAEIIIHPWNPSNPLDAEMVGTRTKIHPVHEAEDGKVYTRKNASVSALTLQEVIELTKSQVKSYYAKTLRADSLQSP